MSVIVDPGGGRLDTRVRKAARRGAPVMVLIGPDERERGEAVVRDMRLRTQVSVPEAELIARVTKTLGKSLPWHVGPMPTRPVPT